MVSRQAARLVAGTPVISEAHFAAEADPYDFRRNPGGYVNIGTAENRLVWDLVAPRLRAPRPVSSADTRYAPLFGTPGLREAVAAFLGRTGGVAVDPENVIVVGGATAALDIIASVLCDPGETIAVPVPYYGAFDTDLTGRSRATLLPVRPCAEDELAPGAPEIAEAVLRARAAGRTVRALALTSPHNPLGRVYREVELRQIAEVCARLGLDLVADEIYANSVFSTTRFTSALGLSPDVIDPERVHVIWGFAKDFGVPGFKVGVLHTRHSAVRTAARELAYFAPVSTDTQWLLHDMLSDEAWVDAFLTTSRSRLASSYTTAAGMLTEAGIAFETAEAGFSIWTDLRPWLDNDSFAAERALWQRLFRTGRVNMLPGKVFHSHRPGWFRLCHTVSPDVVREGVERISKVLTA
ncbi:aminotransferase class I/II-fold pyridoxal phosphate-dependent enzyme [Streptosporangium sp. NPDC000396]|uniref:aminotransferase class I/II-fold pyridoxal phosphate-dependent enzyme n=1 Tax=Streptosporangium sp. NPDC000396 TaxID=3366185 RepID=UPI0036781917